MNRLFTLLLPLLFLALEPVNVTPPPSEVSVVKLAKARASLHRDSTWAKKYRIAPKLAHEIRAAAAKHAVPDSIAFALVRVESNFERRARSYAGARGLSQLMPATARWHCGLPAARLYEPRANLNCGFSYLRSQRRLFKSWHLALVSYNQGPAATLWELKNKTGHGSSGKYATLVLRIARRPKPRGSWRS